MAERKKRTEQELNDVSRVLAEKAPRYRVDIIEMLTEAGSGHPGGSLSAIDIISALYHGKLRHRPDDPSWEGRDRLVLSKGHGVPAQYAVMADLGYFEREKLWTLRKLGSPLQGHPCRHTIPGIDASTGALGQGLSMAQGMALASRLDGSKYRVYCVMGDGETQEGQVWEAALSAVKFKIDLLTVIVDYNKGQIDGLTKDVMDLEPLADKWRAFGWNVLTIDGHDYRQILRALDEAEAVKDRPTYIIAHTIKGKGVGFMEDDITAWHGVAPTREEADRAIAQIRGKAGLPIEKAVR
ncbi:MAG: transketolase [Deltaproteobacteria bacterium]|nr:transketolase [Deltaproteobacteria bacterium]